MHAYTHAYIDFPLPSHEQCVCVCVCWETACGACRSVSAKSAWANVPGGICEAHLMLSAATRNVSFKWLLVYTLHVCTALLRTLCPWPGTGASWSMGVPRSLKGRVGDADKGRAAPKIRLPGKFLLQWLWLYSRLNSCRIMPQCSMCLNFARCML